MKQYPVMFQQLVNGETLAFRKCGTGAKNLVLIHGNMSSSVHYQILMERLEQDYTIWSVDLRGFGESTYNKGFDSLGELAEDVKDFMRLQGIKHPVLAGWSTGGGVAMEVAADIGQAVKGIILISSVGINGYPMFKKDENGAPILSECIVTKEEIAADPVQVAPVLEAYRNGNREYFRYLWNLLIYNRKQPDSADYALYLDAILKQRNLVDVDYSLVHFNISEQSNGVEPGNGRGRKITCPITIMHGEKDMVVPLEKAYETKAFFGEQAELIVMENTGHSILTDNLDQCADIIRSHT